MSMPLYPSWGDIVFCLFLTVACGAVIGFNRGLRGHAAGIRTTILVGLAASAAMIQANILLPIDGKTAASFGVIDLMRLPLSIFTGVGFIGGGAILKRGDLVTGVTTAATLWITTVIGLCVGGGQIWLGVIVTFLTVGTLSALGWLDRHIPREQSAELVFETAKGSILIPNISSLFASKGFTAQLRQQSRENASKHLELLFDVSWKRAEVAGPPLDLLELLELVYSIARFTLTSEARH